MSECYALMLCYVCMNEWSMYVCMLYSSHPTPGHDQPSVDAVQTRMRLQTLDSNQRLHNGWASTAGSGRQSYLGKAKL